MQFGDRPLFVNVNLKFDPNKRYGLVGANGAGKSTFMRILSGLEEQSEGEIFVPKEVKIGALDQDHFRYEKCQVLDVVLMGKKEIWEPLQERAEILKNEQLTEKDGLRLSALEDELSKHGANGAEAEVSQFLAGLGLNPKEKNLPMSSLSGGFKLRVLLAQLLWKNPEVLLLDEPTNHLDIASIRWLEEYLTKAYKGTLLLISHDRDFLNRVCTHMVDFDYGSMQMYTGNYDSFQSQKILKAEQIASEAEAIQKKIAEMQAFVDRFKAKASKARQAQSRAKQLEKMEMPDLLKSSRRYPAISFVQKRPSGKNVLKVENVSKDFSGLQVLKGINFELKRGEKVALIGPNGVGKSTLLNILRGSLPASEGKFEWGYETQISFFSQDHYEVHAKKCNLYDWLYSYSTNGDVGSTRSLLGKMLFSGDDAFKFTDNLSGGESARLLLCKVIMEEANVLLLDEPTNHLDIEAIECLEKAINKYEGTVLYVSHDKHFVDATANRIFELLPTGFKEFNGTYSEYLALNGEDYLNVETINFKNRNQGNANETSSNGNSDFLDRKTAKRALTKLQREFTEIEKTIHKLESEIKKVVEIFAEPNFYMNNSFQAISDLEKKKIDLENSLAQNFEKWETTSLEIAELEEQLKS